MTYKEGERKMELKELLEELEKFRTPRKKSTSFEKETSYGRKR